MLLIQTSSAPAPVAKPVRVRSGAVFVLIVPALIFYVCCASYFNLLAMIGVASLADPISIEVRGPVASDWGSVAPTMGWPSVNKLSGRPNEWPASHLASGFRWRAEWTWVASVNLHATEDVLRRIDSVTVRVGPLARTFTGAEVRGKWKRLLPSRWTLREARGPVVSLEMPWPSTGMTALNWPSNGAIAGRILRGPVTIAIAIAILLLAGWRLSRRRGFTAAVDRWLSDSPWYHTEPGNWLIPAAGLAVVAIGLCILYSMERYPFTQDDNFCQFLPVIVRSAETLANGHFPVWNPYQLLGAPTTTVGTYALTYPPTYLAYWLAHSLMRDDNATIEVFAVLHLLAGYFFCNRALRRFGVSQALSAAGSCCWILSGWFLIGGRSQFNFTPLAVYLPLLIDAVNQLARGPVTWSWAVATGISIGLLFHAGHAELWVYTLFFVGVASALLLATRKAGWPRFLWAVTALLIGIATAAPLLLLQKAETAGILRQGGSGWPSDLLHMLLPLGKLANHGVVMGSVNHEYGLEFFYAGTLFTIVSLSAAALWFATAMFRKDIRLSRQAGDNVWLICACVAFALAFGASGMLWPALSWLPPFDKFRWPIKYTPFAQLFMIFAGAAVLRRLALKRSTERWLSCCVAALMLFHVSQCRATWYTFGDRPYPPLTASVPIGGRSMPIAPFRSATTGFVQTLSLNFPTEYKLLSIGGYDTFIGTRPESARVARRMNGDPVNAARAYGVSSVVWSQAADEPTFSGNHVMLPVETTSAETLDAGLAVRGNLPPIDVTPDRRIYRAAQPDPIAFSTSDPGRPLHYEADQSGIRVITAGLAPGTPVTINFLRWQWITAEAAGKPIVTSADQWDRIQFTLPSAVPEVVVRYSPPWGKSFLAAMALLFAALITGSIARLYV